MKRYIVHIPGYRLTVLAPSRYAACQEVQAFQESRMA